ncbi:MAG: hypothetical protein M0Z38_04330 [Deltaproteobacteria bacterium]|nr:hypothetical protein [Deltaproteobacteria bacterium]
METVWEIFRRWLAKKIWLETAKETEELTARLATCHRRMQEMYWDGKEKEAAVMEIARLRGVLESIQPAGVDDPEKQCHETYALAQEALVYGIDARRQGYFSWITPGTGPVIDAFSEREVIYAKDQPEYHPLPTLRSSDPEVKVMSRWTPDPRQRLAIATGADLYLVLLTFGNPLQPIMIGVGDRPNPEFFSEWFGSPAVPS